MSGWYFTTASFKRRVALFTHLLTKYLGPECLLPPLTFHLSFVDALRFGPYLCKKRAICHRSFATQWERDQHSKDCFWYCPREGCPRKPLTKRRDIDQHNSYHQREDAKAQRVNEVLEEEEDIGHPSIPSNATFRIFSSLFIFVLKKFMISRKSCFPLGINWLWWRTRETVLWFERFTGPRSSNLRYIFWRLGLSYWMVFKLTERRPMLREMCISHIVHINTELIVFQPWSHITKLRT